MFFENTDLVIGNTKFYKIGISAPPSSRNMDCISAYNSLRPTLLAGYNSVA